MAGEKKLKREPFAYISKRDGVSLTYRITVRAAAIVLALVVCGIVTKVLTGDNPISIYQTIVHGAVGKGRLLVTIHDIAILLCISLAVTPAFRMRFWNTGEMCIRDSYNDMKNRLTGIGGEEKDDIRPYQLIYNECKTDDSIVAAFVNDEEKVIRLVFLYGDIVGETDFSSLLLWNTDCGW